MLASRLLRSSAAPARLPLPQAVPLRVAVPYKQFSSLLPKPTLIPTKRTGASHCLNSLTLSRTSVFPAFSSIRFNSTFTSTPTPTPTPPTPPTSSAPSTSPTSPTSSTSTTTIEPFDSADAPLPSDVSPLDFSTLTEAQKGLSEHVGYLHEIGLNFGWGPTSLIQWLLEHVHVWTDAPWWASILLTTLAIRMVMFPCYIKVSDSASKMKEVQSIATPLMKQMDEARKSGDAFALQVTRNRLMDLYKQAGVQKLWLFFPIVQIPIFYGVYKLLKNMADLPVPGFLNGGVAWFGDLSSADPYMILPLVTTGSLFYSIYIGGEAGANSMNQDIKKFILIAAPCISLIITWQWASALTMYFAFNGLLGLAQALLLRNATVREKLGLYPLQEAKDSSWEHPSRNPDVRSRDIINEGLEAAEGTSSELLSRSGRVLSTIKSIPKKITAGGIDAGLRSISSVKKRFEEDKYQKYEREREMREKARRDALYEEFRRKRELKELDK